MKLPDKLYDFLKWFLPIVVPAIETLLATLAPIFEWAWADNAIKIIAAVALFFGTIFGIGVANYNKDLIVGDEPDHHLKEVG